MLKINHIILLELFFLLMISGCSVKNDGKQDINAQGSSVSVSPDSTWQFKTRIIPSEIPFRFSIQFDKGERSKFNLWLPELIIFNCDSSRSIRDFPIDTIWYRNKTNGYSVGGISENDICRVKYRYQLRILRENLVSIIIRAINIGDQELTDYAQMAVCLSPVSKEFSDKEGSRTYVIKNEKLVSIKNIDVVNDYNHYPVKGHFDKSDPDQRVAVTDNYVCRKSVKGDFWCSITWDESVRIDVNPGGLDCFHSHPAIGPLKKGESLYRYGIILFSKSTGFAAYEKSSSFLDETLKYTEWIKD